MTDNQKILFTDEELRQLKPAMDAWLHGVAATTRQYNIQASEMLKTVANAHIKIVTEMERRGMKL